MENSLAAPWLSWWQGGFCQQADGSWHHLPWFQLTETLRQNLLRKSPQSVSAMLGVAESLPDEPDARLLALLSLEPQQRITLLALVAEVCQRGSRAEQLEDRQRLWCERLTRSLRPGVWLPVILDFNGESDAQALYLLRPLFTAAVWQRLRFLFHQSIVAECEALPVAEPALPLNRLQALWDGAIWQAQRQSGASSSQHDQAITQHDSSQEQ